MDLEELYEPYEKSALKGEQKRSLLHSAYWHGVSLAKLNGVPETSAADNRALELAFLRGYLENRKYREGASI